MKQGQPDDVAQETARADHVDPDVTFASGGKPPDSSAASHPQKTAYSRRSLRPWVMVQQSASGVCEVARSISSSRRT
jgi:hypothetical protein